MSSYASTAILSEGSVPSSSTSPTTSRADAVIGFAPRMSVPIPTSAAMSRSSSHSSTSSSQSAISGLSNYHANWPYGSAHRRSNSSSHPSAYVTDEDLFGDDLDAYICEPPPTPRTAEQWAAMGQPPQPTQPEVQLTKSSTSSIAVAPRRTSSAYKRNS